MKNDRRELLRGYLIRMAEEQNYKECQWATEQLLLSPAKARKLQFVGNGEREWNGEPVEATISGGALGASETGGVVKSIWKIRKEDTKWNAIAEAEAEQSIAEQEGKL